jgi:large subunit ribosomal protein L35
VRTIERRTRPSYAARIAADNRGGAPKIQAGGARLYSAAGMPKMKSHSGAKKRFKKTGTGKLQGRHAFSSHILEKKSPKRKRSMSLDRDISKADRRVVTKLLGGNGR